VLFNKDDLKGEMKEHLMGEYILLIKVFLSLLQLCPVQAIRSVAKIFCSFASKHLLQLYIIFQVLLIPFKFSHSLVILFLSLPSLSTF